MEEVISVLSNGPKYVIKVDGTEEPSISKGNEKVGKGIYTFSLLPGSDPISISTFGLLTDVKGTCDGVCDGCEKYCYAVRDAKLHHNATIPAWTKNTLLMRYHMEELMKKLDSFIKEHDVKVWRWHVAGEIESYEYLKEMNKIAENNPTVKFGVYSKRFNLLEQYLNEFGSFAPNFCVNVSEWNHNTDGYKLDGLNRFVWDDGNDESISKMIHCPAVSKPKKEGAKGKRTSVKCEKCQRCYNTTGSITAVYNH